MWTKEQDANYGIAFASKAFDNVQKQGITFSNCLDSLYLRNRSFSESRWTVKDSGTLTSTSRSFTSAHTPQQNFKKSSNIKRYKCSEALDEEKENQDVAHREMETPRRKLLSSKPANIPSFSSQFSSSPTPLTSTPHLHSERFKSSLSISSNKIQTRRRERSPSCPLLTPISPQHYITSRLILSGTTSSFDALRPSIPIFTRESKRYSSRKTSILSPRSSCSVSLPTCTQSIRRISQDSTPPHLPSTPQSYSPNLPRRRIGPNREFILCAPISMVDGGSSVEKVAVKPSTVPSDNVETFTKHFWELNSMTKARSDQESFFTSKSKFSRKSVQKTSCVKFKNRQGKNLVYISDDEEEEEENSAGGGDGVTSDFESADEGEDEIWKAASKRLSKRLSAIVGSQKSRTSGLGGGQNASHNFVGLGPVAEDDGKDDSKALETTLSAFRIQTLQGSSPQSEDIISDIRKGDGALRKIDDGARGKRTQIDSKFGLSRLTEDHLKQSTTSQSNPTVLASTWRDSLGDECRFEELKAQGGELEMKRQEVIWEMSQTEVHFVTGLAVIMRIFVQPLKNSDGQWNEGVPIPICRLFDWLEDIVQVHTEIQDALLAIREEQNPLVLHLAEFMIPHIQKLKVYQPYLMRFEMVTKMIHEMTEDEHSDFGKYIRLQSRSPECAGLSLNSFLLKPVQRLMKYPIFFRLICELTPSYHFDHFASQALYAQTQLMLQVLQVVKAREEEYEELRVLESRIRGLPTGFSLAKRDRTLLSHGLLRQIILSQKDQKLLEGDSLSPSIMCASSSSASGSSPQPLSHSTSESSPPPVHTRGKFWSKMMHSTSTKNRPRRATSASLQLQSRHAANFSPTSQSRSRSLSASAGVKSKKAKAKEIPVEVFVFSDIILFTSRQKDGIRFIRHNNEDRMEQVYYRVSDGFGLSRILDVQDLSGQVGDHEYLIKLEVLPLLIDNKPNPDPPMSVYLTVRQPIASGTEIRSHESFYRDHNQWMNAFTQSHVRVLNSLFKYGTPSPPLPSSLSRTPSCDALKDAEAKTLQKCEKEWWDFRFKQVREEAITELGPNPLFNFNVQSERIHDAY